MSEPSLLFIFAAVGICVLVVVFWLARQFVLWYFRLNEIADHLATIADHHRRQEHNRNGTRQIVNAPAVNPVSAAHDQRLRGRWE